VAQGSREFKIIRHESVAWLDRHFELIEQGAVAAPDRPRRVGHLQRECPLLVTFRIRAKGWSWCRLPTSGDHRLRFRWSGNGDSAGCSGVFGGRMGNQADIGRSHTRGVAAGRGNRLSILRGGHATVGRQTYYRSTDASLMAEFRRGNHRQARPQPNAPLRILLESAGTRLPASGAAVPSPDKNRPLGRWPAGTGDADPVIAYRPGVVRGSRPMKAARRSQSSAPGAGTISAPKGAPGSTMSRY
jgi:hypothetical protein